MCRASELTRENHSAASEEVFFGEFWNCGNLLLRGNGTNCDTLLFFLQIHFERPHYLAYVWNQTPTNPSHTYTQRPTNCCLLSSINHTILIYVLVILYLYILYRNRNTTDTKDSNVQHDQQHRRLDLDRWSVKEDDQGGWKNGWLQEWIGLWRSHEVGSE